MHYKKTAPAKDTSWQGVKTWYNKIVGSDGHYYHEHVVMPGVLKLLQLKPDNSLVDLGCGQGVLSRNIPPVADYLGLDLSAGLIGEAKRKNKKPQFQFETVDVARPIHQAEPIFTHAAIVLALQNMENAQTALNNAARFLVPGGKLVIVLNHPCFRIPRQSGWDVEGRTKIQYRWINKYLSPMKIPITMHPGKMRDSRSSENSAVTWSFHHSLQDYSQMLNKAGFVITKMEEWTSDKESEGKAAKQENRARAEFPLFMALSCRKE